MVNKAWHGYTARKVFKELRIPCMVKITELIFHLNCIVSSIMTNINAVAMTNGCRPYFVYTFLYWKA